MALGDPMHIPQLPFPLLHTSNIIDGEISRSILVELLEGKLDELDSVLVHGSSDDSNKL